MPAERGGHRRALAACGLGWVLVAKILVRLPGASLPRWQRWSGGLAARLPAPPPCTPEEAAWAITAAARRVPRTRCLEWALALRGLFAQAGIASELRIGVRAGAARAIEAHAWIDCGGHTWSWGDAEGYSVLRPRAASP